MAVGIAPALDVLAGVGEAPELAVEVARALGDGVTFGELEIPGVGDGNVKSVVFFSHAASARNAVAAQNAPPSARQTCADSAIGLLGDTVFVRRCTRAALLPKRPQYRIFIDKNVRSREDQSVSAAHQRIFEKRGGGARACAVHHHHRGACWALVVPAGRCSE
jgi:hypothetical protein